jgi:hypothetical protein
MSAGQALGGLFGLMAVIRLLAAGEVQETVAVVLIALLIVAVYELIRGAIRATKARPPIADELSGFGDLTGSQNYSRLRPGPRIWRAFRRRHESQEDRYRHAAQDLHQFRADVARESSRRRANHLYKSD